MSIVQFQVKSKFGPIYLLASEQGLIGLHFERQDLPLTRVLRKDKPAHRVLRKASEQLKEYFSGRRKKFDLPLVFEGTRFQKSVWRALSRIPYGTTISYTELAARIRNPRAVRAAGTANGKNPFCIIVPCHRVISANGTLGGYTYGLDVKRELLALENAIPG